MLVDSFGFSISCIPAQICTLLPAAEWSQDSGVRSHHGHVHPTRGRAGNRGAVTTGQGGAWRAAFRRNSRSCPGTRGWEPRAPSPHSRRTARPVATAHRFSFHLAVEVGSSSSSARHAHSAVTPWVRCAAPGRSGRCRVSRRPDDQV
jgi:hypothetical protein